MEIQLIYTRPKSGFNPISRLIRWVESTPYSHISIRWYSKRGLEINYESSGSHDLRFIGSEIFNEKYHVVDTQTLEVADKLRTKLNEYCLKNAGRSYGRLQIIGMGIARLLRLNRNPVADGKKTQVCSELVGYILTEILNIKLDGANYEVIGPRELHNIVEEYINERMGSR